MWTKSFSDMAWAVGVIKPRIGKYKIVSGRIRFYIEAGLIILDD